MEVDNRSGHRRFGRRTGGGPRIRCRGVTRARTTAGVVGGWGVVALVVGWTRRRDAWVQDVESGSVRHAASGGAWGRRRRRASDGRWLAPPSLPAGRRGRRASPPGWASPSPPGWGSPPGGRRRRGRGAVAGAGVAAGLGARRRGWEQVVAWCDCRFPGHTACRRHMPRTITGPARPGEPRSPAGAASRHRRPGREASDERQPPSDARTGKTRGGLISGDALGRRPDPRAPDVHARQRRILSRANRPARTPERTPRRAAFRRRPRVG